jgi:hypothetical protein
MTIGKPIEIIITPENKTEFEDIYLICRTYTDMGKPVPSSIVARLFDIMYGAKEYSLGKLFEQARSFSKIAVEKIRSMKEYQFAWQDRILEDSGDMIKLETEQVFTELIYAFLCYKEDYPEAGKDEAIAFFYWAFDDDYKEKLQLQDKENFTKYKQAVVSGILTIVNGFKLTDKTDSKNDEIFQATRNAIKKYQKRKDLW